MNNIQYLIKTFDRGVFYGYVAEHPDDSDMSYYSDDLKDAITFNNYEEAYQTAMFKLNGSKLEFVIGEVELEKKQCVWTVRQHQPEADIEGVDIYACSSKEEAIRRCRILNREYGEGCYFDENWDIIDIKPDIWQNSEHYYEVGSLCIDDEFDYKDFTKNPNPEFPKED